MSFEIEPPKTPRPSELAASYGYTVRDDPENFELFMDGYSNGVVSGNLIATYWLHSESFYQAMYDQLTGLPNRAGFFTVSSFILENLNDDESVVVHMADANRLKEVNDTLGHETGNRLLQKVAAELSYATRYGGVARIGGDEFVALSVLPPQEDFSLDEQADLQTGVLRASSDVSVGHSRVYSKQELDSFADAHEALDTMLSEADAKMYEHKRRTRERRR